MKNFLRAIILLLLALKVGVASSADVPDILPDVSKAIRSSMPLHSPELSKKELKGAALAKKWMNKDIAPIIDGEGRLLYPYGSSLPTIVCAPLQLCDLELQPGEKVSDVHAGDPIRWIITKASSGTDPEKITHLNIKPTEPDLSCLIIITTDRRTYHIKLVSKAKEFMPRVGFYYPSEMEKRWAEFRAEESARAERNTIPETSLNLDDLYFDYLIEGSAPWKPLRVYHDGKKTYIQMPKALKEMEAPALLLSGRDGKPQIVNYRLRNDRYIVDSIFSEAILISGVGSSQTKITIIRKNSEKFKAREVPYEN